MSGFVERLSRRFALLGGTVLIAMILTVCLSVLGRSVNSLLHDEWVTRTFPGVANTLLASGVGPITGDFELVEAGMAFAIFAFLPLCQLTGSHASVTIFTGMLPDTTNRILGAAIDIMFAAMLVLIAWQLSLGMLSKRISGQTSFLLQFPIWWAYAASLVSAAAAAFVAVYVAGIRIIELVTSQVILPDQKGVGH